MKPIFKVIVAGSRGITLYTLIEYYLDMAFSSIVNEYDIVIISGMCRGPDLLGKRYAELKSFTKPIEMPADCITTYTCDDYSCGFNFIEGVCY